MEEWQQMQLISKQIQLDIAKGKRSYHDEEVQFFIPVALYFTDFDWLELIAENTLVKEDEKIVKNFLSMVKSLKNINEEGLNNAIKDMIAKR